MKFQNFAAMLIAGVLVICMGCHTHDHDHPHAEDGSHAGHDHGEVAATHEHDHGLADPLSYTVWSKKTELFVDFPPLVVNQKEKLTAHFTDLLHFKGIGDGTIQVRLRKGEKAIAESDIVKPSVPGIFLPYIHPPQQGTFQMDFILNCPLFSDTITIPKVVVYESEDAAFHANPPQAEGDEISFLKEQVWKTDFAIQKVKRQPIREVIHTSGEIKPVTGEQKIIAARSSGIVFFKSKNLQIGRDVKNGETLFNISSEGLLQSNMKEKHQIAKARIDKTKADLERAEKLLEEQIIGLKEYEQRKMEYSIAEAEFQTLTGNYNAAGQSVKASMTGIVKKVMVSDGQFVKEGTPLVQITRNRRLLLQADVSQRYLSKLGLVKTANFKTAGQSEIQRLEDYNGKLISYGKMIEPGSSFIPVLFELDNLNDLIPGSFVELFLLSNPIENDLVIPKTALMQDYNLNYVFVQLSGESFEKREVKLGIDDGVNVQVLTGIAAGEWVVTTGAYQVKMASMSSSIPAHGHTH